MDTLKCLQDVCRVAGLLSGEPTNRELAEKGLAWATGAPNAAVQPTLLKPVLATLGEKDAATGFAFKPQKLSLAEDYFPDQGLSEDLAQDFLETIRDTLEENSHETSHLLRVLEWYGSSIGCHPDYPDISLYDLIKTGAAISFAVSLQDGSEKLRLVGAQVSGIQDYLNDIISQRAAKLLKGRSFYVQILVTGLLKKVLEDLNLPDYATIYASGGGFYIIVPDTPEIEKEIKTVFQDAVEAIYESHDIGLFVDWAYTDSFDPNQDISSVWDELIQGINRKKFRRLHSNTALWNTFLEDAENGGLNPKDPITNQELKQKHTVKITLEEGETIDVHRLTKDQISLGRELRSAQYWAVSSDRNFLQKKPEINDPFGNIHWLEENPGLPKGKGYIQKINAFEEGADAFLYGGNAIPVVEEEEVDKLPEGYEGLTVGAIKTYDLLAQGDSFDRLGVLRMDIDGLGGILSDRVASTYGVNLARYTAISRSLDWFFKGYINTIHQKYKSRVLVIYSGGDDLFVLGRWKEALEFAIEVQSEFKRWVCFNPALTISGGLAIVPGKFPVIQAARMAGGYEDDAKEHIVITGKGKFEKNAFYLLGYPLNWSIEFPIVDSLKKELESHYRNKKLTTRSLLTKISMHALSRQKQEKHQLTPRWRWEFAYDLSRYRDSVNDKEAREFIDQIISDVFNNKQYKGQAFESKYHILDLLLVACRWVDLELRTEK